MIDGERSPWEGWEAENLVRVVNGVHGISGEGSISNG